VGEIALEHGIRFALLLRGHDTRMLRAEFLRETRFFALKVFALDSAYARELRHGREPQWIGELEALVQAFRDFVVGNAFFVFTFADHGFTLVMALNIA
jgi:hypothetical protein